jgi:DNA (cytosine-5)-methyltransferase 1
MEYFMGNVINFKSFITTLEASRILGVSKGTLRKWETEGKIRALRHPVNGYRLFDEAVLRELLWKLQESKKL